MIAPLIFILGSCGGDGFAVVSIRPIYGWDIGCNTVKVSGHGFADDASVRMADNDLESPKAAEEDINKGFYITGVVPEAAEPGPVDVIVSSGKQTSTLSKETSAGYFYVKCPGPTIDAVEPAEGVTSGTPVVISGCDLDPTLLHAVLVDGGGVAKSGDLPLTSDCRTGIVDFDAPALPDGTYFVEILDGGGAVVLGTPCSSAPDSGGGDSAGDSAATSDTGTVCTDYPVSFGGAQ